MWVVLLALALIVLAATAASGWVAPTAPATPAGREVQLARVIVHGHGRFFGGGHDRFFFGGGFGGPFGPFGPSRWWSPYPYGFYPFNPNPGWQTPYGNPCQPGNPYCDPRQFDYGQGGPMQPMPPYGGYQGNPYYSFQYGR